MREAGCTYKVIAESLGFSKSTVQYHLKDKFRKHILSRAKERGKLSHIKERRRHTRKAWALLNPEIVKEYGRKQWAREKDDFDCRCRRAVNSSRQNARKHGHEACSATKEELKAAFDGKCYLCDVPEVECNDRLCVEHDHETGEFRGWACRRCNTLIMLVENFPELVDKFRAMHDNECSVDTNSLALPPFERQ